MATYAILGLARNPVGPLPAQSVPLPDGKSGIGFDDLLYSSESNRLLVPGGQTGNFYLIDPLSKRIQKISGFSKTKKYSGGHSDGITSADSALSRMVVTNRTDKTIIVFDPLTLDNIFPTPVAGEPDYVRIVRSTREVWVTEPHEQRIQLFKFSTNPQPLTEIGFIDVPGGPESLVIDEKRNRAYTNSWKDQTFAIDLTTHQITAQWNNSCVDSRGLALDVNAGLLFVGCSEGKAVALDLNRKGKIRGAADGNPGIDVISYNAKLSHLYLSSARIGTFSIFDARKRGSMPLLGSAPLSPGSHCVASDDENQVWVCDPDHGQLLLFQDNLSNNR